MRIAVTCPYRFEANVSGAERAAVREVFGANVEFYYACDLVQEHDKSIVLLSPTEVRRFGAEKITPDHFVYMNSGGHRPRLMRADEYLDLLAREADGRRQLRQAATKGLPTI